jgi:type IV pilus assembly protein PilW
MSGALFRLNLRRRASRARARGYSLVELMIASTIGLFLVGVVSAAFVASKSSEKSNSAGSEIATNGNYAMTVMRRDFLLAGFQGITWATPSPISTAIGTVTNECLGAGFATNLRQNVWGANNSNPFSASCIPAANYSTGDVVVIRHVSVDVTPVGSRNATTLYFRSSYERGEVYKGTTVPAGQIYTPFFDYALETNVYYISPHTVSASESPKVPALYRLTLGAGPAMTAQLVASNVEDMQVQYGRYTTDLNTRFYNANSISGLSTEALAGEWDDVTAVQIWLLVRGTLPEPGYTNTNTYTLGDRTVTVNDGYRREVMSAVVNLRNF